jgi:MoaA/NifB/PqqE/SkfB family radical SAM enzyme
MYKVAGRYYNNLYNPGWPSAAYTDFLKDELLRHAFPMQYTGRLSMVFFAITRKCPLRCEHCFEWDNLNKKETFDQHELKTVIRKFQEHGISQFHLSGGEPLTRPRDLVEMIKAGSPSSEFYVLTSGFNFTALNAKALKQAGLTGVVISLDHFDEEKHNAFRHSNDSYLQAINAIKHAQNQNLVVALSLCVTKEFVSKENLFRYAELAKKLKVTFIQLLEPKAVGHYQGMDVLLKKNETMVIENFYETLQSHPSWKDYPILIYHGYYQRRIGCMSGGNRALYIDSAGFINACPFCHTKNFNIREALENESDFRTLVKSANCPIQ